MINVFKTNIQEEKQASKIIALLNMTYTQSKVSFDLEDCDRILRVESNSIRSAQVILLLRETGFECEELD